MRSARDCAIDPLRLRYWLEKGWPKPPLFEKRRLVRKLEINEMNLARLLFPWSREFAKTTCVQTDRRMLRLKNYVALTEDIEHPARSGH